MAVKTLVCIVSLFFISCNSEVKDEPQYTSQNPFISTANLRKLNLLKDSIQWVPLNLAFSESAIPNRELAYAYSDDQHKGGSKITVKDHKNNIHCFDYHLQKLEYPYYPYAGWGRNFPKKWNDIKEKFKWISYSYKGVIHNIQPRLSSVKDYLHFRTYTPQAEQWTKAFIQLDKLTQPSFAKKVEWNPELLYATDWLIQGSDGEMGSLCIGNIKFGYLK